MINPPFPAEGPKSICPHCGQGTVGRLIRHVCPRDPKNKGDMVFYCDQCAEVKRFPKTAFKSNGPCEVCGEVAVCNEVSAKDLPNPTEQN